MNAEIDKISVELLDVIKNYIDAHSISGIANSVQESPPETIIKDTKTQRSDNLTFSQNSIKGLPETLESLSKEIKFIRETLGI